MTVTELAHDDSAGADGLGYKANDADNHYYETVDCFSRHIDPDMREFALQAATLANGREVLTFRGQPLHGVSKFLQTEPPGSLKFILDSVDFGAFRDARSEENMQPEFKDRDLRLQLMDRQGLQRVLLFPTSGIKCEDGILGLYAASGATPDTRVITANISSFNRWLNEEWGFNYKSRIYAVPMLSLCDLEWAIKELKWCIEKGARFFVLGAGPAGGRSPADPVYDPFWAVANDARMCPVFHLTGSDFYHRQSSEWSENWEMEGRDESPFQLVLQHDRQIMDGIAACILHNLFGRFPSLRLLSVEYGARWTPYLQSWMDHAVKLGRYGPQLGGRLTDKPSDIFREYVWVNPYPEDDLSTLLKRVGLGHILFGSDYPHPEGLADPVAYASHLEELALTDQQAIMRDNFEQLLS